MRQIAFSYLVVLACIFVFAGCKEEGAQNKVVVEEVKAYKPNLPAVPSIPKPSVGETYADGSFSVYGLRKGIHNTIETLVTVTGYIVKIYEKPVCAEGQACVTLMPHLYIADERDEKLETRMLRLVGYANNFQEMEEEKERVEKGEKPPELPEGIVLPPVIWDWRLGNKYKIAGRFTRQSGAGFMDVDGLIEYESHQCLDCPVEEEKKQ